MVLRDVDFARDGAGFLDVVWRDGRLAIGQTVGAAVVDALNVRAGDC